jgi:hypothetical protein
MPAKNLIILLGVSALCASTNADPLLLRSDAALTQMTEGMHDGWSVTLTDTSIVAGQTSIMFLSGPCFRVLEYTANLAQPIQPVPPACFPTHPRLLLPNGLPGPGPWPEGNLSILTWNAAPPPLGTWTQMAPIDPPVEYTGEIGFSTVFGSSISATTNGEYLLVGSAGSPGIRSQEFWGLNCNPGDCTALPGVILPRGHLDLYRFDIGTSSWVQQTSFQDPCFHTSPSGQPTALCACDEDLAVPVVQNGLGYSTKILRIDDGGFEKIVMLAGMPLFDGNGAYPVFGFNFVNNTIQAGIDVDGTCLFCDLTMLPLSSIECARDGGLLVQDNNGILVNPAEITACCVGDCCAGDMTYWDCVMIGGMPFGGGLTCVDDDPCPTSVTIAFDTMVSDPTACGRGAAFLAIYDPLIPDGDPGQYTLVGEALDLQGNDILINGYGPGIMGLIPDPLAAPVNGATGDPFPHQLTGYAVDAVVEDGVIWIAVGAPYTGGVSGVFGVGTEPECTAGYPDDTSVGPLNGRVILYTLDIQTMSVSHVQTITAQDGEAFHGFGASLSLSGSRMAIGAPGWHTPTTSPGAVYIYELNDDGIWVWDSRIHAADNSNGSRFGEAVSLFEDKLAVGAPMQDTTIDGAGSGAFYRFNYDPATEYWVETEILLPPMLGVETSAAVNPGEQHFGRSVALTDRFVSAGGPQLVEALPAPGGGLALTNVGGVGLTDSRPIPPAPPPPPLSCNGDMDGSDVVDVLDLIHLLRGMGLPGFYPECDLNDDSAVDVFDLLVLIDQWGQCS